MMDLTLCSLRMIYQSEFQQRRALRALRLKITFLKTPQY